MMLRKGNLFRIHGQASATGEGGAGVSRSGSGRICPKQGVRGSYSWGGFLSLTHRPEVIDIGTEK
jgi:hypothetical protein